VVPQKADVPLSHCSQGRLGSSLCSLHPEDLKDTIVTVLSQWPYPVVVVFMLGSAVAVASSILIRRRPALFVVVVMIEVRAEVFATAMSWLTYPVVFVLTMLGFSQSR
jgi:hypothetical protein